jgi:glycosyltransferase involved in cell wall biosynthesis
VPNNQHKNPPKLCIVTAIDATIYILLLAQIKAAQEKGFIVHGICAKGENFEKLQAGGIKMHPVAVKRRISPFSDLKTLWQMYRYFRSEKIDIVHTHTPKCSLLGQLAARLAGVKTIINTVHGFYFHDNMRPAARRFYIFMEKIAAKCSSIILSQNPEDIETAAKTGICKADKIRLLGNGVDLSKFHPSRFDDGFKKTKRKELGIPEKAVVVGIIGRLVREKGFLELFEAMKNIVAKNDNAWLVIIGPEEPHKTDGISGQTFTKYGIAGRTVWLGSRNCSEIPQLLSCVDIYALPSWREGFPRSAIEAAAMGLPVVATNIRGCRQVVEDGVNGLLVPPKDTGSLEIALTSLISNRPLREKMGQAGYKKARLEFDEQRVCQIVLDTYNELLAEKI